MTFTLGFVAAFVCGLVLAALWRRMGRGDVPGGEEADRKLQAVAVPAVGGLALLLAWHLAWWREPLALARSAGLSVWDLDRSPPTCGNALQFWVDPLDEVRAFWFAAIVAFCVGWLDDMRSHGLSPRAKAAGQLLAGACLALPQLDSSEGWLFALFDLQVVLYAIGGFIACNAINTFDNADGAAAGVTGAGLFATASPLAPAVLGFAALQLLVRRGPRRDAVAYLGDAGSHLLGIVVLASPASWPLLTLPLLDLLRVSMERQEAGQPPWKGDRRHLAHRLQRMGHSAPVVVLLLLVISAPVLVWQNIPGLCLSVLLFAIEVLYSRGAAEAGSRAA